MSNLPSSLGPSSFIYKTINSQSVLHKLSQVEATSGSRGLWTMSEWCPIMSHGTVLWRRAGNVRKRMGISEQHSGQFPCYQPIPALPSARFICQKPQWIRSLSCLSFIRIFLLIIGCPLDQSSWEFTESFIICPGFCTTLGYSPAKIRPFQTQDILSHFHALACEFLEITPYLPSSRHPHL